MKKKKIDLQQKKPSEIKREKKVYVTKPSEGLDYITKQSNQDITSKNNTKPKTL